MFYPASVNQTVEITLFTAEFSQHKYGSYVVSRTARLTSSVLAAALNNAPTMYIYEHYSYRNKHNKRVS